MPELNLLPLDGAHVRYDYRVRYLRLGLASARGHKLKWGLKLSKFLASAAGLSAAITFQKD